MSSTLAAIFLTSLDENAFEEWLLSYLKGVYHPPVPPRRHGRRGQVQQGVDIFFQSATSEWIGVQAKAYRKTRLTTKLIDEELKLAEAFRPPLARYIICTLNDRDAAIQAHVRGLLLHGKANVEVMALQDLAEDAVQNQATLHDLWQRIGAPHIEAAKTLAATVGPAVVSSGTDDGGDGENDATLKAIEDWIDEGHPVRALAELARYPNNANATSWLRIRVRAQFAQGQLALVLNEARQQLERTTPDPIILAYGAHAAHLSGDMSVSDDWLARALAASSPKTRFRVVGTYVRVHAAREDLSTAQLEDFARDQLGSELPVALAIADAAFILGDFDRALHWYALARERQALWPSGAEGNALSATIWQQIELITAGGGDKTMLRASTAELTSLVGRLGSSKMRFPLLLNLGFAHRALRQIDEAAIAWDEVLASDAGNVDVWIRRCILSAVDGAPLPTEEQATRWAVNPMARLALVGACTALEQWSRAELLIDAVADDSSASRHEHILAEIERVNVETRGRKDDVTASHVSRLLAFAADNDPSPALFMWLVDHFRSASSDDMAAVRAAMLSMAGSLTPDPLRRLAIAESVVQAGLDDVAVAWLPEIERIALSSEGRILNLPGALLALRVSARTFRFGAVRSLVSELRPICTTDANAALHCAKALEEIGDRAALHALLTQLICGGQHHVSILLAWARNAVRVGQRRAAHRLIRQLSVELRHTHDYVQLLQLRGLLGVHGDEGLDFGDNTRVTAANAAAVFGAGILTRSRRRPRVAYNRIVHVRISHGLTIVMDERFLMMKQPGLVVDGVRTLANSEYPWLSNLIGAAIGDRCDLTYEPFDGYVAEVVDVWDAVRWAHSRAAEMLHMLPHAKTGVQAFSGEIDVLRERLTAQVAQTEDVRRQVAVVARKARATVAMAATQMAVSPRALLQRNSTWVPSGSPGTKESIEQDDKALSLSPRLVLDPITVLLLVDLKADDLLPNLPARPAMSPQAVMQLFDWWYSLERQQPGTQGHMVRAEDGQAVIVPVSAAGRMEIASFWRRLRTLIAEHVDIVEPDGLTNSDLLQVTHAIGPSLVSGIALAEQRGWAYVSEEGLISHTTSTLGRAKATSLHRLAVYGVESGWWPRARGFAVVAGLIKRGWSWVGHPIPWLEYALRHPGWASWDMVSPVLLRLRHANPVEGLQAMFRLLLLLDNGQFPGRSPRSLRTAILAAMPRLPGSARRAMAGQLVSHAGGELHRRSKEVLWAWVQDEERYGPLSDRAEEDE